MVRSDAELAARLGTTANVVQSRLIAEVRDALGFDRFTPQLRQTLVSVALSQGLVPGTTSAFWTWIDERLMPTRVTALSFWSAAPSARTLL